MIEKLKPSSPQTIVLNDKKYVLVPEKEYESLAGQSEVRLPPKNAHGNYPAIAATE